MSKKIIPLFVFAGAALLSIGLINVAKPHHSHGIDEKYIDENGNLVEPIDIATHTEDEKPEGKYEENVVLVKTYQEVDTSKIDLDVKSIDELYPNSSWKKITLEKTDAFSAVKKLRKSNLFEKVDYNYIMASEEIEIEEVDVSSNPNAGDLPYIESNGVGNAWGWGKYKHNHGEENIDAGGSPDVIIAVIDTGVDYNHVDLRNNIWTNTAEIPDNGVDDDDNGYIDDVRGWDCVNEDNDPIDDNGHGTHVAGIAAAENNDIGTVGVAFNCKIMPIKAASSGGFFNGDDIAQAVAYAYMNGASVINMSFGGSSISLATQDALQDAYHQCALIAAAGNNALCSQPDCGYCKGHMPIFPGSIPYIVGVMSCNDEGTILSGFSNYDHNPYHYNQYEYDCYACGEQICSTWPNNKLARLSGTSMASPVVAGIAALLRSAYPDRDTFSSKYIHSQLTNTGRRDVLTRTGSYYVPDYVHPLCDAYSALTEIPKPYIKNLYDYYAFDNVEFSPNNNGDGFIDAGETIRLGIELQNRGGKATNITAKIDAMRSGDSSIVDPNVEIVEDTIHMDEIGTYSIQDGGKIYDGDKVVNMENAFVMTINPNVQNGYECLINLHIEYYNGLDETDHTKYEGGCTIALDFSSGQRLSGAISEDTTFSPGKKYLIDQTLTILSGATVTFEAGCEIELYNYNTGYIFDIYDSPTINVYGTLIFDGNENNRISIRPNGNFEDYFWFLNTSDSNSANIEMNYCDISNMVPDRLNSNSKITMNHSILTFNVAKNCYGYKYYENGTLYEHISRRTHIDKALDSMFIFKNSKNIRVRLNEIEKSLIYLSNNSNELSIMKKAKDSIFCFNDLYGYEEEESTSSAIYLDTLCTEFSNNTFVTDFSVESLFQLPSLNLDPSYLVSTSGNTLGYFYSTYDALIKNNYKDGIMVIKPNDVENHNDLVIWPYIKDISILDKDGNVIHTVGTEKNTVRVTFSREMDQANNFSLFYGSWEPYSDYEIKGEYKSDTVWEGELQVKATIEGGIQRFSSKGGCAKNDSLKELVDNSGSFTFNIDTSSAMSMNLQANPTDQGVELTWVQDDYDTLMGYNIYRSESNDGNYVKINSSVIPAGENTFFDDSCEPGKEYWYTFTVVLSDFSESAPAGKVSATPIDTISPTIYHNPVNQGYANNNLVISCTASDNIAVQSATLYYRTVGDAEWKSLSMSKANDRFSATIFGSEVTLEGIEYYISVTDGRNIVTRGSAENPYTVTVKDPSLLDNLGDVDGDGAITTKDALMIVRAINDELILTDDQFQRADLNKDGELSTFEALRILQYVNGKINVLEM